MGPLAAMSLVLVCMALGCGRLGLEPWHERMQPGDDASVLDAAVSDASVDIDSSVGSDRDTGVGNDRDAGEIELDAGTGGGSQLCVADSDSDGVADCRDTCPDDPAKAEPGVCGCMMPDVDSDHDGSLDCVDRCGGSNDASYVPDTSCGVGYCRTTNTPSTCSMGGVEAACQPGTPLHADDATCDAVDDDCDGSSDEDFVVVSSSCGQGVCAATGMLMCVNGGVSDNCQPGAPASAQDGLVVDGIDQDCDGAVDEDAGCDTAPRTFLPGVHDPISVPINCSRVTVRIWGGGGASGETAYGASGGRGGAGGYGQQTFSITGPLMVWVGTGAAIGCNAGGTNAGTTTYAGGAGGVDDGAPGADGATSGGGAGAQPGTNRNGGNGYFGGGGGGASDDPAPVNGPPGVAAGGGGGAASAFFMGSVAQMIVGGGGGGGGAASVFWSSGIAGGAGGSGCGVAGAEGMNTRCGGGGGGGACFASTWQAGSSGTPANSGVLPAGQAAGGNGDCVAGGGGYAIVTFAP